MHHKNMCFFMCFIFAPCTQIQSSQAPSPSKNLSKNNSFSSTSHSSSRSSSAEPQDPQEMLVLPLCEIIDQDPKIFLQTAQNMTHQNKDPRAAKILTKLFKLGLKSPVKVQFKPDDISGTPVGYIPTQVTIRDSFWQKSNIEQLILLAQVANRLNNNASEIETLAREALEQNSDLKNKAQEVNKELHNFYRSLDNSAILGLIQKAQKRGDLEYAEKLNSYLTYNTNQADSSNNKKRSRSPEENY